MEDAVRLISEEETPKTKGFEESYVKGIFSKASRNEKESIELKTLQKISEDSFDPEIFPLQTFYIFRKLKKFQKLESIRVYKLLEIALHMLIDGNPKFVDNLKANEFLLHKLISYKGIEADRDCR